MRIINLLKKENISGLNSIIPMFLFIAIFFYYPTLNTFFHSLTKWDGLNWSWIGLDNFTRIFSSGDLWLLLRNNFIFLMMYPGILIICIIISVLVYEEVFGWKFFRSVFYIPTILSAVVVGFLMKIMFSTYGTVNQTSEAMGLDFLVKDWLQQVPTAFVVLIFCYYWQTLGQGVLIFLAGMSSISTDMIEASKIGRAHV